MGLVAFSAWPRGFRPGLCLKRVLDFVASTVALVLLAVPFALIGLAIRLDSPGPVFFRQERVGKGGRPFRVWKFRTMVKDAERIGLGLNVSATDERITRVGRFLREWALDELPQLINVWLGEMSLVGPRPTVPAQVAVYNDFERRRLEVKPGITGWAQIHGRNAISWDERIRYDVWYVDHWSFWLDLYILLRTIPVVLSRQGLYGPGGINDDLVSRRSGVGVPPGS